MEPPQENAITENLRVPILLKPILCSFAQVLDFLLEQDVSGVGYKYPRALVHPVVGKQLLLADPEENYVHICLPSTELNEHKTKYLIWEKGDWNISYESFLQKKEESKKRVERWEKRKAKIAELSESMADMLGIDLDADYVSEAPIRELLRQKAATIVDQNSTKLAAQFGVTL